MLQTVTERLVVAVGTGATATAGRLAGVLLRAGGGWPWVAPATVDSPLHEVLRRAAGAAEGDRAAQARILAALAVGQCYHPDASVPAGDLRRAAELAAHLDDPEVTADVLLARLLTYSGVATHTAEAVDVAAQLARTPHAESDVDAVIADSVLTMALMTDGEVAGTAVCLRRGIEGSERMRLPVLRAQLRWMEMALATWRGDFATARSHAQIAMSVHFQTEMYVSGSGALSLMAKATQQGVFDDLAEEVLGLGDGDQLDWARAALAAAPDDEVVLLLASGVAVLAGRNGDVDLVEQLIDRFVSAERPMVWTSLSQAVLLGDLVADFGLTSRARFFADYLAPFADRIATVGQVGCVGPVDVTLARLCFLLGEEEAAGAALDRARRLSESGGSLPGLLRCRLLTAQQSRPSEHTAAELREIAQEAAAIGMRAVAEAANRTLAGSR